MNQQAFTLIELLIAVTVIALLSAIMVPNLLAARNRGHDGVSVGYGRHMLGYATSWLTNDPFNKVSGLKAECTASEYVSEGASLILPASVTACEIIKIGSDQYGVKVRSISGKEFIFTN